MIALVPKKTVLVSNCPYSKVLLQSECSGCYPIALFLHYGCPYIECPYKEKSLNCRIRPMLTNNPDCGNGMRPIWPRIVAGHSQLYPPHWHQQIRSRHNVMKRYKPLPGQVTQEEWQRMVAVGCVWKRTDQQAIDFAK